MTASAIWSRTVCGFDALPPGLEIHPARSAMTATSAIIINPRSANAVPPTHAHTRCRGASVTAVTTTGVFTAGWGTGEGSGRGACICRIASINSVGDWKRSAGLFSSSFRIIASNAGEMFGLSNRGGSTG